LLAAVNADPANPTLNPIGDAVDGTRAQLGAAWPYGDLPKRR
jgi:hypothetical protein